VTQQQAIKLAIQALDQSIRSLAMDANLHEKLGADYPAAIAASKRRKQLREAKRVLQEVK
jgi:hypothetical protein